MAVDSDSAPGPTRRSSRLAPFPETERDLYLRLTGALQALLAIGLGLFLWRREWDNVALTVIVILLSIVPAYLGRYKIVIPPEFQLVAALFAFLSIFLGSAFDLYARFWWWDIVLHTSSGFLLGIIGFLVLFLLNQTDKLPEGISPAFLCLFGVTFAVTLGVVWEIFEFAIDQVAPSLNMQTTETGVRDTMADLIVDTIGAALVGLMGYAYLKTGRYSFIADGVQKFIRKNPWLIGKEGAA